MISEAQTKDTMDRMYRLTRHVYDFSRKYYLLGRDVLIRNLNATPEQHIYAVGCGTARNLIKMAQAYPETRFHGLDASEEMLKTARRSLKKYGLDNKISLEQGYAQSFEPRYQPDKIVFSYALSIIPPWKDSLDHAITVLPAGGEIHIVDFGSQDELPGWFRRFLFWWLSLFHVYHKPEIPEYLRNAAQNNRGTLTLRSLYKGYAYYAVFTKT